MTPEVTSAIEEIQAQFPGHTIHVGADRNGGACVVVEDLPVIGFEQPTTWVGFHVTEACPYADTYPHFVRPDLKRVGAAALGEAMTTGHVFPHPGVVVDSVSLPSRQAIQVSRRSNRRDLAGLETPLLKLMKVMKWINRQ